MTISIFGQDAFDKMVEVEGEDYRRFRNESEFGVCSFEAFLEKWKRDYAKNFYVRTFKPEFGIDVEGNGAIYGLGGWNRYVVLNSGEIAFIRSAAKTETYAGIAKRVGFRLW